LSLDEKSQIQAAGIFPASADEAGFATKPSLRSPGYAARLQCPRWLAEAFYARDLF
jgi:hypothetical protein